MKYKTEKKEILKQILKENHDKHLTSKDILEFINKNSLNISQATLYRILDDLVEEGYVKKFIVDDKSGACFQYVCDNEEKCEHFHCKCIKCGKIIHLDCDDLSETFNHIKEKHKFYIDPTKITLVGICEDCKDK